MDWRAAFYFDDAVSMCVCVCVCVFVCVKREKVPGKFDQGIESNRDSRR